MLGLTTLYRVVSEKLRSSNHYRLLKLGRLAYIIMLLSHWVACAYYTCTFLEGFTPEGQEGWLPDTKFQRSGPLLQYWRSLYYSVRQYAIVLLRSR